MAIPRMYLRYLAIKAATYGLTFAVTIAAGFAALVLCGCGGGGSYDAGYNGAAAVSALSAGYNAGTRPMVMCQRVGMMTLCN